MSGRIAVPRDFFGIHVNNASPNGIWKQRETPLPQIGAKAIRLWDSGTAWRDLNPERGRFDFSRLDYRLDQAKRAGFEVMLTLGQAPDWAAPTKGATIQKNPNPPYRLADWNAYVGAIAGRYGDRIDYYEIWNEPDLKDGFDGSVQQLLGLAESAHRILKAAAPQAKVMSPAFSMPFFGRFPARCGLRQWVEAGGLRFCDAVSVHAYPGDGLEPERVLEWLDLVKSLLRENGAGHLPLYDTESGGRGWRDAAGHLFNIPETKFGRPLPTTPVDLQSAWVTRHLLCVAMSGLRQSYYFTFDNPSGRARTQSVMSIQMTDYPENPARLLPPALAYRYLASILAGGELDQFVAVNGRFGVRLKTADGRQGTVHWTRDYGNAAIETPRGSAVFDNLGRRLQSAATVSVGPSPIFVFEA